MTDHETQESIKIFCEVDGEIDLMLTLSSHAVPLVGDTITFEEGNEAVGCYKVTSRRWLAAKQGADTFAEVHLFVEKDTASQAWMAIRSRNRS